MSNPLIERIKAKLKSSEFLRNSLIMIGATVVAQTLPVLAYPILTRLYTPEQFGVYSLFFTVVVMIGMVSGFKYESAIVLPLKKSDADNLLWLSFLLALSLNLLLLITMPIWKSLFIKAIGKQAIEPYLTFIPIAAFFIFAFTAFGYYFTRFKRYKLIGGAKVSRATSAVLGQIGLSLLKRINGLIVGFIFSYLIGSLYYVFHLRFKELVKNFNWLKIRALSRRYKKFAWFYTPSTFLDRFAHTLINFLIPLTFGTKVLGLYALAYRLLSVPIMFIGQSINQVFYQEFSDRMKQNQNLLEVYLKVLKTLLKIFVPSYLAIFILVKPVFGFIFGQNWVESGLYLQILTPLMLVVSLFSPLGVSFIALERQNLFLLFQTLRIISIVLIFLLPKFYNLSFVSTLIIYSAVNTLIFSVFLFISYWLVKKYSKT